MRIKCPICGDETNSTGGVIDISLKTITSEYYCNACGHEWQTVSTSGGIGEADLHAYIDRLEYIIYNCVGMSEIMLHCTRDDQAIYNTIVRKFESQ